MNRGDIVVLADRSGGDWASKPRPAVVIQSDAFGQLDSLAVCPLTTQDGGITGLRIIGAKIRRTRAFRPGERLCLSPIPLSTRP